MLGGDGDELLIWTADKPQMQHEIRECRYTYNDQQGGPGNFDLEQSYSENDGEHLPNHRYPAEQDQPGSVERVSIDKISGTMVGHIFRMTTEKSEFPKDLRANGRWRHCLLGRNV